jgi:hypothetical protein
MVINECLLQATRWEEEAAEVSGYLKRGFDGENLDCGICPRRGEAKKKSRLTLGLGKKLRRLSFETARTLTGKLATVQT